MVLEHLFWLASRAAGTTALVTSSASVGFGLLMAARVRGGNGSGPDRRTLHEMLALSTMVAIVVHALSLIGDSYLHPSVADVTVPFVSSYKTLATSVGIVAGWSLIFLGLSYYLRKRIGNKRWKMIHRFTLLAWALGLVHAFTEGTDAGQLWFIALIVLTAAPALVLVLVRLGKRHLRGGRSSRPAASSTPATA